MMPGSLSVSSWSWAMPMSGSDSLERTSRRSVSVSSWPAGPTYRFVWMSVTAPVLSGSMPLSTTPAVPHSERIMTSV